MRSLSDNKLSLEGKYLVARKCLGQDRQLPKILPLGKLQEKKINKRVEKTIIEKMVEKQIGKQASLP